MLLCYKIHDIYFYLYDIQMELISKRDCFFCFQCVSLRTNKCNSLCCVRNGNFAVHLF